MVKKKKFEIVRTAGNQKIKDKLQDVDNICSKMLSVVARKRKVD